MRTPKRYTDLIKNKKITNQIIAECIYSVNKIEIRKLIFLIIA